MRAASLPTARRSADRPRSACPRSARASPAPPAACPHRSRRPDRRCWPPRVRALEGPWSRIAFRFDPTRVLARAARPDLPRSTAALPARYRGPRRCLSSGPPTTEERFPMRTRRRRIRSRAYAASVLAALAAAIAGPTVALAVPADTQYPRPVPQTTHLTPSGFAAKVGDTPADFGRSVAAVAAVAKVGDTPSDFGRPVAAAAKV